VWVWIQVSVYEYMCMVCGWYVCGTGQQKMDKGGEGWGGVGRGEEGLHGIPQI